MTAVDALSIAVRSVSFIAIFQSAGAAIFIAFFRHLLSDRTLAALRSQAIAAAFAALAALLLHFALEAARMGGDFASALDPSLQAIALQSPLALAAAWKSAGVLLIAAGMTRTTSAGAGVALFGAAVTCFGFTQAGHTTTLSPHPALQILLWVHVAIGAFWFGSLLPLNRIARHEPAAAAAGVVARFSAIAGWLVPILAIAGLGMAVLILQDLSRLKTPYGVLILFKIALFATLVGLAVVNKWRLGPALRDGGPAAARRFVLVVRLEYLLIVVVLLATAVLTTLFSPHS